MPSCARASMIREPAIRTLGFERCASATSWSSAGSSKTFHQSSSLAGGAGCNWAASSGDPPRQSSTHGTSGRSKSGPTAVQPLISSAASTTARRAGRGFTAAPDIVQAAGCESTRRLAMVHPTHEDLVTQCQQDGTHEQPEDSGRRHAAERAQQDHRHRCIDAAAQHQRLEEIVRNAREEQHHGVDDGHASAVVAAHPDVGDGRDGDEHRRNLRDAEHQHDDREHAGKRYLRHEQRDADGDGLDERHANDALRYGANGRRRQLDEFGGTLRAHDLGEDGLAGACAGLAECHDHTRNQERRQEHQESAADAGHERECRFREVADLRLHALHQRRQVGMRLRPVGMDLLADDRPLLHAGARRGNLQGVVLDGLHVFLHGIGQRSHQHRRGRDDQHRGRERDQGGRQALLAAEPARKHLVEGVQGDGEDQCPDHQRQERREDPVAQRRKGEDQAGADQHVEHLRRVQRPRVRFRLQGRIHLCSPCARPYSRLLLPTSTQVKRGRDCPGQCRHCGRGRRRVGVKRKAGDRGRHLDHRDPCSATNASGSERLEFELGAAERGLVHQPTLDDREGSHAFLIAGAALGRRVTLSGARA